MSAVSTMFKKLKGVSRVQVAAVLAWSLLIWAGVSGVLPHKPHVDAKGEHPVGVKAAKTDAPSGNATDSPVNTTTTAVTQPQSTPIRTATAPVLNAHMPKTTVVQPGNVAQSQVTQADTPISATSQTLSSQPTPPPAMTPTPAPVPKPFGITAPGVITVRRGQDSGLFTISTTDGSAVTWQLAGPAGAWEGMTSEKSSRVYPVAKGYNGMVASSISFYVHAERSRLPLGLGYIEPMFLRITDPARGISMVYTPQISIVL